MKIALIAAFVAGMPVLSRAFTLDAVGYGGSELSHDPVTVFVPGYGELVFETAADTALVVNSGYGNDSGFEGSPLGFDPDDTVKITFSGVETRNLGFDLAGLPPGENLATGWSPMIPEPATAMIGLLGSAVFAFRRRR